MSCNHLPVVPHAEFINPELKPPFQIDEFIKFKCVFGYTPSPKHPIMTCTAPGIWILTGDCQPKSCPPPPNLENGNIEGRIYVFSANVIYRCNNDYTLLHKGNVQESMTVYCSATGQWQPPPKNLKCVFTACPSLSPPQNGSVEIKKGLATYTCFPGFTLIGDIERMCLFPGKWSGKEPRCTGKCSKPGPFINCSFTPEKSAYNENDFITLIYEKNSFFPKCVGQKWFNIPSQCFKPTPKLKSPSRNLWKQTHVIFILLLSSLFLIMLIVLYNIFI